MSNRLYTPESSALTTICREWYVTFGAMTLAVVLSLWVHPLWMPLIDLGLAVALALFGPGRKVMPGEPCGRLTIITVYILLATGLVSFSINLAYHTSFIRFFFDISTLNHSIPYITSLVLFPICTLIAGLAGTSRLSAKHARLCHLHNEYNPSQPMFGRVVHGTYRSMLRRMALMGGIISVIDWAYYFLCYSNMSINTPDRFFFFVVPGAMYVWSIIYVHQAYSTLTLTNGRIIRASGGQGVSNRSTLTDSAVIRFLVIHNGNLLLNVSPATVDECSVDTPVTEVKPLSFKGDMEIARRDFEHLSGVTDFNIRKLYKSENPIRHNTIYHYLIHIPDDASTGRLHGEWTPLDGVDRMLKMGVVTPQFADEIFRVYTTAMAWKTYDRKGRRLYPIRNYHPNFRLADIHKWDVDYEDNHWLRVSRINQDAPLWFLRRLWL